MIIIGEKLKVFEITEYFLFQRSPQKYGQAFDPFVHVYVAVVVLVKRSEHWWQVDIKLKYCCIFDFFLSEYILMLPLSIRISSVISNVLCKTSRNLRRSMRFMFLVICLYMFISDSISGLLTWNIPRKKNKLFWF